MTLATKEGDLADGAEWLGVIVYGLRSGLVGTKYSIRA
jgi:hypothetical protein